MYKADHPIFISPSDVNAKLWKYMNLFSFVSLLEHSALWFSRSDKLRDKYEGLYPAFNDQNRKHIYKDKIPSDIITKLSSKISEISAIMREYTLINCWHQNDHESAAMWDLYAPSQYGIAVQTTFKKLTEAFANEKADIYIGLVRYIDYDTEWMPEGNLFFPFMHKRKSFSYENEVRVIFQEVNLKEGNDLSFNPPIYEYGKNIKVDITKLVENIFITPDTPDWIYELIKRMILRYNYNFVPIKSNLYKDPLK